MIVFFKSLSDINEFLMSQYPEYYQKRNRDEVGNINVLSEETCDINEIIIKKATSQGVITFATRDYGRGTNFFTLNKQLNLNGGVHVIQTF